MVSECRRRPRRVTARRRLRMCHGGRSPVPDAGEHVGEGPGEVGGLATGVQRSEDVVDDLGGLSGPRTARRTARRADPDLDVRAARDADLATPDLRDRLTATHVLADGHECWLGVPVVHVASGVAAAVEQQDRGRGAEAANPLADDRARVHRDLDDTAPACPADGRDVDALVKGPVGRWNHERHWPQREHPPTAARRSAPRRAAARRDVLVLVNPQPQRHRGEHTDNPAHGVQTRRGLKRCCGLLGVSAEHAVRCRLDPDRGQPPLQCLHVTPTVSLAQHPTEWRWRITDPSVLTDPRLEGRRRPGADHAGHGMQTGGGLKPCCRLPCVRPEHAVGGRPRPHRGQPPLQRLHIAPVVALTEHSAERGAGRRPRWRDQPRPGKAAYNHRGGREQHRGAPSLHPVAPCTSLIGESRQQACSRASWLHHHPRP